jgi:hypothetical protein
MSASIREMPAHGLNPLTEEGNTAYAKFLYETTGPGIGTARRTAGGNSTLKVLWDRKAAVLATFLV